MSEKETKMEGATANPKYLYHLAEDSLDASRGSDQDEAFDIFVIAHGREPDRILGVIEETGSGVNAEIVWENDLPDAEREEGE